MTLPARWQLLVTVLLTACAGQNRLVATPEECIRVHKLHLTRETRAVVNATLIRNIDTRRRAYEAHDFCAFQQPTSNNRYALLTIYDEVGNHTSPTWLLLSRKGVVDTQLSSYQMTQDSLRSIDKMILGLTRLPALDEGSRQELLQLMQQDAHNYRKRATDGH
ncbi:hypothetical protein [Hymenobacter sp. BT559]|uniref:hypothetical protein n=1 Tax=Hymenobacter sp. BT559 TaxID=2795729 RepID=UPI0018EAA0A6|nr:hypothetical protein [Hymenobacter sp. BT559]MBJ6146462.1 hypothetical protein [Hymenobacter sp. BT559]